MNEKHKAIFCWSGGKDSAYCLHKVLTEGLFDVKYLLTTVNDTLKRISMHGVREELLDNQAESIGIPLLKVRVTESTNEEYERQMQTTLLKAKSEGIDHVIFGDIFLEDLRIYRENNLAKVEMKGVFPLWKMDTTHIIHDFIRQQFKTVICCTNDAYLGEEWAGIEIDNSFIGQLPVVVDPCGENGEYHTFCYDGPLFKKKIDFTIGEKIYKPLEIKTTDSSPTAIATKGFWFCDLLLKPSIDVSTLNDTGLPQRNSLQQHMVNIFNHALRDCAVPIREARMKCSYLYSINNDPMNYPLDVEIPVLMVNSFPFKIPTDYHVPHVNNLIPDDDPVVCEIASRLLGWLKSNAPSLVNGWLQFEVYLFSEMDNTNQLPVLRLSNLELKLKDVIEFN